MYSESGRINPVIGPAMLFIGIVAIVATLAAVMSTRNPSSLPPLVHNVTSSSTGPSSSSAALKSSSSAGISSSSGGRSSSSAAFSSSSA